MNDAPYGRLGYNFSIVGCQKSGTSTLSGTISQHRLVCRPPRKEAHFFNNEDYDWESPDYEADYTAPKRSAVHSMVGDSTPVYIMWPGALERMRAYKPDMPLIAVFRDPIERLFSHWTMLRTRHPGWPDWSGFITEFRPTSLPSTSRPTCLPCATSTSRASRAATTAPSSSAASRSSRATSGCCWSSAPC